MKLFSLPTAFPKFSRVASLLLAALAPLTALRAQTTYTPYTFTTLAGSAGNPVGFADGTGAAAHFFSPHGVAVDAAGNIYVADTANQVIRKVSPAGVVTLFAGSPGATGSADGTTAARFNLPFGVAADSAGNVYVADTNNYTIRKITPGGVVSTIAGSAGNPGAVDDTGSLARFSFPASVAVDAAGNLYVADSDNDTIRKITTGGVVSTIAGSAGNPGAVDGTGSFARFDEPEGVTVDGSGNVFVTDFNNHTVRKITSGGVVSTIAGLAGTAGSADGTGAAARFTHPIGIAVNASGILFVCDSYDYTVRRITSAGVVTTLGGVPTQAGASDGSGDAARFYFPASVAVTPSGLLYVADETANTVRKGALLQGNDFNADGSADIVWQNVSSGELGFWLMNGTTFASWIDIGALSPNWQVAASADFNGDGNPDLLWENISTGERYLWFMSGTTYNSGLSLGIISTDWHIAAAADFNADGKPDILWENTVSGDRGFWLMNGTTFSSWVDIGPLTTDLRIVGTGDFNSDGMTDIVWENTSTGKRVIWLMNGTTFSSSFNLGVVDTVWHIAAVADYDGDGKSDILWANTTTGDRGFWLMNGTTFSSWVDIGNVTTNWHIAP